MPKLSVLILFALLSLPAWGQLSVKGETYQEVRSLKRELLQYSESYETYLPYLAGQASSSNAAVLQLRPQENSAYNLALKAQERTAVLINNQIVDYIADTSVRLYSFDSLASLYPDSSILSLYHPNLDLSQVKLSLVSKQPYTRNVEQQDIGKDFLQMLWRPEAVFNNFFIVAALVLLAGFAVLRSVYPKVFSSYYNLERAFATRVRDEPNFQMKLSGRGHLAYLIHYSLLFSFLLLLVVRFQQYIPAELDFLLNASFITLLSRWLLLAAAVFLFQLVKYILLQLMAGIFNLKDFAGIHFFDFLRISLFFYTFLFAGVIVLYWAVGGGTLAGAGILLKVAVGFGILRVLIIYLKLVQAASFRKTYLFSYLCTTEILPLLIGLRLLL